MGRLNQDGGEGVGGPLLERGGGGEPMSESFAPGSEGGGSMGRKQ